MRMSLSMHDATKGIFVVGEFYSASFASRVFVKFVYENSLTVLCHVLDVSASFTVHAYSKLLKVYFQMNGCIDSGSDCIFVQEANL